MSLCFLSLYSKSLPRHIYNRKTPTYGKGASFCICQKGSYTLESAIIFPLLCGIFVSILFLFRVIQVQTDINEAMIYAGRKVAVESSDTSTEKSMLLFAQTLMYYHLKESNVVKHYVQNGSLGVSLLQSECSEHTIDLYVRYQMKLPIDFFGIYVFSMGQKCSFQRWIGDRSVNHNESSTYVYVTESGSAYHASKDCRALDLSIEKTTRTQIPSLRGSDGQKYYACSFCNKKEEVYVYFTKYGTLYHSDIGCGALKRTILRVKRFEVGNRKACYFCYLQQS
ncbi:MAG: hypothetical protein IKJ01_07870 [Lachnospiraceae bacterium]|nr:hypothetical protein [Lachnospiraceae bacterium]